MQSAFRILISAFLIYGISELSKRHSFLGSLLASLPLVSIIAMTWLWRDTHVLVRIARFSASVFWLAIPSLAFFAALPPLLLRWRFSFPIALGLSCAATVVAYLVTATILRKLGIDV